MEHVKEYTNGEVTIVWKQELCAHSGICVRGLPNVFKPKEKPWIHPHTSTSDELVNQIKKCPSGALSFYYNKDKKMSNISETLLVNNQEKKRFELEVEGKVAFIEYILNNENIMFLTHTEVPVGLEGKGVGSVIVSKALDYIKDNGYTLAPLCPFVAAYLKRHPERKEILAKGFNV